MKNSSFTETELYMFNAFEASGWNLLPSELKSMYTDDFAKLVEYIEIRRDEDNYLPFDNHDLKDFLINLFDNAFGG